MRRLKKLAAGQVIPLLLLAFGVAGQIKAVQAEKVQVAVALNFITAARSIARHFETGNGRMGLVAASQVRDKPNAKKWLVPARFRRPLKQDAVLLQKGRDNKAARAFLKSHEGTGLFNADFKSASPQERTLKSHAVTPHPSPLPPGEREQEVRGCAVLKPSPLGGEGWVRGPRQ